MFAFRHEFRHYGPTVAYCAKRGQGEAVRDKVKVKVFPRAGMHFVYECVRKAQSDKMVAQLVLFLTSTAAWVYLRLTTWFSVPRKATQSKPIYHRLHSTRQ